MTADAGAKPKAPAHLNSLDGARGIAAFLVMVGHSAYVLRDSGAPSAAIGSALRVIYRTGHPAVLLFFVLSGFVLYVANWGKVTPWSTYVVRRLFRLYPALLASIVAALALHMLQNPQLEPGLGAWTTAGWVYGVDGLMVLRHLLMLGINSDDIRLNPVIWSLVLELRFSIIFLALAALCRRSRWLFAALSLAAYIAGLLLAQHLDLRPPFLTGKSLVGSLAVTLFYLPAFSFGILAADLFLSRPDWRAWRIPTWSHIPLALAALVVAKLANNDLVWAASCAVVILVACLQGPLRTLLQVAPCTFLGRISYSLYLIHFPILMALTYLCHPQIPLIVPVLVAPTLSILAATAMHAWIELPGIEAGKRVGAAMARWRMDATRPDAGNPKSN